MSSPLKKSGRIFYALAILAASLLFTVYVVERAIVAPLTIDEAATYWNYIAPSPMAIFNFNSANNHVVNTLLVKCFSVLGGNSEFVLRLPNLLAFVVYLLFSFLILHRYAKHKILVLFGYILLAANPYVLDFFSLGRGYGLSLAFLMASLFFFFSFLDPESDSRSHSDRRLSLALSAAGLAVLSNFSLLNVYLGLVLVAFMLFLVRNRQDRIKSRQDHSEQNIPKKRSFLWFMFILTAVLFNILAVSWTLLISKNLYEPVAVKITGLSEADKQRMDVFRMDIRNQGWRLIYDGDIWTLDAPVYFSAIKFRCLPDVVDKIKQIEIRIGQKTFIYRARHILKMKYDHPRRKSFIFYSGYSDSLKRSRFPVFKSVINWKGDPIFLFYFLARMLLVSGIYAVFYILLDYLGFILKRRHILAKEQFSPLARTTFGLALFIGYPLYFLKKSGEFYWGGRAGFVKDTVFSLVNNSFYGHLYFRQQEWAIFGLLCLVTLGFLILLYTHYRKRALAKILPGLSVFTILAVVFVSSLIQRGLFDNPYLTGRTGLFLIPLFTLLLVFLVRGLALHGTSLKIISFSFLAILTALALCHFAERANTTMTVEWRSDADTKSVLTDLRIMREKDVAGHPKIALGIDDIFFPSFEYYLQRTNWTWLEVNTVPPFKGNDVYYLENAQDSTTRILPRMTLLKTYPLSGNSLLKPEDE